MSKNINNQPQETTSTQEKSSEPKYTEEQARDIYIEGQKTGYITAIKQIRSNLNDYLNDLIVDAGTKQK